MKVDNVKVGDRVRLLAPVADNYPPPGLPTGSEGTVNWVGEWRGQIGVDWDSGRRLMLLDGDRYEVVK